jgi:hypothetical protein
MKRRTSSLISKIGTWSFIIGVLIAVFSGFFRLTPQVVSILVVLGVIVGLLNVTGNEAMTFLLASVSMVVISSLGSPAFSGISVIGATLQRMLNNLIIFVIPASMIVALRAILTLAYKR